MASQTPPAPETPEPKKKSSIDKRAMLWIVLILVFLWIGTRLLNKDTPPIPPVPSREALSVSSAIEPTGNKAHDLLIGFSERQRMNALAQFLISENCSVNRIFYQGMSKDRSAFWGVGCAEGKSYQIMISPDEKGSTKILDCAILKLMTNIGCFEKLK